MITGGGEKYFWELPIYQKWFKNATSSAVDIFMNMTYRLGTDWQMYLFYEQGLVYFMLS